MGKKQTKPQAKKKSLKGLWTILGTVLLGIVLGVGIGILVAGNTPVAETVYEVEDLHITLPEDFQAFENERFTGILLNQDVGISFLKEPFQQVAGSESLSLEEYGHLVIGENGIIGTMLCTEYGLTYFEFLRETQETGDSVAYFAAVYKSNDAFWLLQFSVAEEDYESLRPDMERWARSVTFE